MFRRTGFGATTQDLVSICNQIKTAVASAPPAAQSAIQSIMSKNTGFSTPGFGTVQGLVSQLAGGFNPPGWAFQQDYNIVSQALSDITSVIAAATPPPAPVATPLQIQQAQQAQISNNQAQAMVLGPTLTAPSSSATGMSPAVMGGIGIGLMALLALPFLLKKKSSSNLHPAVALVTPTVAVTHPRKRRK